MTDLGGHMPSFSVRLPKTRSGAGTSNRRVLTLFCCSSRGSSSARPEPACGGSSAAPCAPRNPARAAVQVRGTTMIHPSSSCIATGCGVIALLGVLCLPGFGGDPQPQGTGAGNISWERFKKVNPKAGIEKAQASFGIWKEGGLAFLILTDFVGSSRDRGSGKGV